MTTNTVTGLDSIVQQAAMDVRKKQYAEDMFIVLKKMVATWDAYLDSPKSYPAYSAAVLVIKHIEGK